MNVNPYEEHPAATEEVTSTSKEEELPPDLAAAPLPPGSEATTEPSQEERTMAALAHASVVIGILTGGIGGVVAALIIWLVYKEKSAYVAFQSLQATAFQGATLILAAVLGVVVAIAWAISGVLTVVVIGLCLMPGALILTLALLAVPIIALGYGLFGALETYQGRDFRYWLIADMIGG